MIQVAAGIIHRDGRVLIARRKAGKAQAHKWEFPGGKLEPGETAEQCLQRELFEELGVTVSVGAFVGASVWAEGAVAIELLAYWVEYVSGDLILVDHEAVEWVLISELERFDFAPADVPVVRQLIADTSGAQ